MLTNEWWRNLSPQWQNAFAQTFFKHDDEPTQQELVQLSGATVLRLAGPAASHPNISFQLTDLSGIAALTNLEILIVAFHNLQHINEVQNLRNLKSLFLNNNQIMSLQGIENLELLEQLYVQFNQLDSIAQVSKLVNLKELYVHDNNLASLQGLTENHSDKLEHFFCKPNCLLKQKELLRVERELYIRCQSIS